MVGLFMETGMASRAGMGGLTSISWLELQAFNKCGGLELKAWELSQLMEMSKSYCQWQAKGGQQPEIADDVPYINKELNAGDYLIRQRDASAKNAEVPKHGKIE
jgi:hypothetical protein